MVRFRWLSRTSRIVALCSAANFINSADRVIMPIAIVPMADTFGWDLHVQGWILSAFAFGYFTSQILGGVWARVWGANKLLVCSVLLWSGATFVTPMLTHSISALIMCRTVLGFAEGLGLPTIIHLFAHAIPVEERSRAFSYLIACGSVGQTVASIVCPHLAYQNCFYWFGAMGVGWVLIWWSCYPSLNVSNAVTNLSAVLLAPETSGVSGNPEDPLISPLSDKCGIGSEKRVPSDARWGPFQKRPWWLGLLLSRPLWAIYTAHFAMNWSSYIIMQWLPTYLVTKLGANAHALSLTAAPYIVNGAFGVVSGHVADGLLLRRTGWSVLSVRRLMTSIGLVGPALFLAIFCVVNELPLALFLVSISMGLAACNSAGHLSNHVDVAPNHAGTTFAISNTLATMPGILCGPVTASLVTGANGRWQHVFLAATFVNLFGALVYFRNSVAVPVV